jgi:DNA helicase-2/ATP-dependent DNA helicase PcrA
VSFTDDGWSRLVDAAEFFHELRQNVDLSVADIVKITATRLGLDIEGRASLFHQPQAYREAFDDLVHGYLSIPSTHTLRGFVEWVEEVEAKERITARSEEPEPGVVQVITIHSSKGLEWDVVAIPRSARKNNNPSGKPDFTESRSDANADAAKLGWLQLGALPNHVRGEDNPDLPEYDWAGHDDDVKKLLSNYSEYIDGIKSRLLLPEERRVMYVAVTRARHRLWISGAWFDGTATTSKVPSDYFTELQEVGLLDGLVIDECPDENPDTTGKPVVWPARDPLGSVEHRERVERAAALVETSTDAVHAADVLAMEHLLAHETVGAAQIPIRIPASRYAEWAMDVAAVREGNRRPVPSRPYRAARLGTEVHLWIERGHFDDDFVDGYRDPDEQVETDEQMEALKRTYLASRWPGLTPVHREIEILLPQGNHIVVCKIDAVFQINGRYVVVDWKTGKKPSSNEEKDQKAMQLVLYRRALAALYGIDVTEVDAVLYYIAHDWEWTIERERLDRLNALPPIE